MNCPYCGRYFPKKDLVIDHMTKTHPDRMTDTDMTPAQILYYSTHGTIKGVCMCGCGKETEWNYKTGKPYKLSNDPKCRERVYNAASKNYKAVHGISRGEAMKSAEEQKKMQEHRPTAGKYKFADGGELSYLSKLELSFLKFVDTVMELPSKCIMEAPQSFKYFDEQSKTERLYMPDFYMPDYNLIVEIKEGGEHPNTNQAYIEETKYKEKYKDRAMKLQNEFNFIKVVDNKFGPFVETLYNIVQTKSQVTDKKKSTVIVITESACTDIDDEFNIMKNEEYKNMYVIESVNPVTHITERISISPSRTLSNIYTVIGGKLSSVNFSESVYDNTIQNIYQYIGSDDKKNNLMNIVANHADIQLDNMNEMSMYNYLNMNDIHFPITGGSERISDFVKLATFKPRKGE